MSLAGPTHRLQVAILAVCLLATLPTSSRAQELPVRGTVLDVSAGTPLAGATVFVNGTTLVTESAEDGSFELPHPPMPWYTVVAWKEGYDPAEEGIVEAPSGASLALQMSAATPAADLPPTNEAAMSTLKDALFTWSNAGRSCAFENPDILHVMPGTEEGTVQAVATAPLVVTNGELGYRMTWIGFRFSGSVYQPRWQGRVYFEEHGDAKKNAKKWRNNRKRYYRATFRHFVRALADDRLGKELFAAYHVTSAGFGDKRVSIAEMGRSGFGFNSIGTILKDGNSDDTRTLTFTGWLYITHPYTLELDKDFIRRYWPVSSTTDRILEDADSEGNWIYLPLSTLVVDRRGIIMEDPWQDLIAFEGEMAMQRFDRAIPYDYEPD